jgi:hypothetical protein
MKPLMMLGALVTALGILALLFRGGIDYTSRETVASGGNVRIEQDRAKTLEIPAAAGALVLAGGVALMILAARQ